MALFVPGGVKSGSAHHSINSSGSPDFTATDAVLFLHRCCSLPRLANSAASSIFSGGFCGHRDQSKHVGEYSVYSFPISRALPSYPLFVESTSGVSLDIVMCWLMGTMRFSGDINDLLSDLALPKIHPASSPVGLLFFVLLLGIHVFRKSDADANGTQRNQVI